MPATTPAAKSAGDQIEFSKYAIHVFFVIMNSFNQFATATRKRIFFLFSYERIQLFQTRRAHTGIKCLRQKRSCRIADQNT